MYYCTPAFHQGSTGAYKELEISHSLPDCLSPWQHFLFSMKRLIISHVTSLTLSLSSSSSYLFSKDPWFHCNDRLPASPFHLLPAAADRSTQTHLLCRPSGFNYHHHQCASCLPSNFSLRNSFRKISCIIIWSPESFMHVCQMDT